MQSLVFVLHERAILDFLNLFTLTLTWNSGLGLRIIGKGRERKGNGVVDGEGSVAFDVGFLVSFFMTCFEMNSTQMPALRVMTQSCITTDNSNLLNYSTATMSFEVT